MVMGLYITRLFSSMIIMQDFSFLVDYERLVIYSNKMLKLIIFLINVAYFPDSV